MSNTTDGPVLEEWLGQILVKGEWIDYARGTEAASREWQAANTDNRRVVDWIYKERVLIPSTNTRPPRRTDMSDTPTFNGYANQPSLDFELWTANTQVIYETIHAFGTVMLQRVPSMTPQTLGVNIKDNVRTLIDMAQKGERLRFLGWGDQIDLPQRPLATALLQMAAEIGMENYHLINEVDIGESWRETLTS